MQNLLEETLMKLEEVGKTMEDVVWIGSSDGYIPIETFKRLADVEYSPGFGSSEVATDLLVVGDNWWLERGEYDGSEWWEYKTAPIKPNIMLEPIRLNGGQWTTLFQMQFEDNYLC